MSCFRNHSFFLSRGLWVVLTASSTPGLSGRVHSTRTSTPFTTCPSILCRIWSPAQPSSTAPQLTHTSVDPIFLTTQRPRARLLRLLEGCRINNVARASGLTPCVRDQVYQGKHLTDDSGLQANSQLVWTPLIPATMNTSAIEQFSGTPMGRPGQPSEVATCFVFLASQDSSFISGQSLHPNGGVVLNG